MKNIKKNSVIVICFILTLLSCNDLDLNELAEANSSNWFSSVEEFRASVNEGYLIKYHPLDGEEEDRGFNLGWDDDQIYRDSRLSPIKLGALNSEFSRGEEVYQRMYAGIARMIIVVENVQEDRAILNGGGSSVLSAEMQNQFEAEAKFMLGIYWTYLITHFGDVPFTEDQITPEEGRTNTRTDKNLILAKIYEYFDFAINNLPVRHSSSIYATKGAALAYKARTALYMSDYQVAAAASKECIDLNEYSLHPNFGEIFLPETKLTNETIFQLSRSEAFRVVVSGEVEYTFPSNIDYTPEYLIPRTRRGFAAITPSWQLLASYECVDGLPIDESPLFDPKNPFKNRDPRLLETIVPFGSFVDGDGRFPSDGSRHMDLEFSTHPNNTRILDYVTNRQVSNNDTKRFRRPDLVSGNGLFWKKGITNEWSTGIIEKNTILMRYADVLLMYAESKIELNQIDASVLAAINQVRDRAYANSTFSNPTVTTTDQSELRYVVRNERRSEFAFEGLRYMDIIRWRTAHEIMDGGKHYGILNFPELGTNVINQDNWFWALTPDIDENGNANFDNLVSNNYALVLANTFFPVHQYLWPIPARERLLNPNLTQNDGY